MRLGRRGTAVGVVAVVAAFATAAPAWAHGGGSVSAPHVGTAPAVDGTVGTAEWAAATALPVTFGTYNAEVRFLHDGANLYVGVTVQDSAPGPTPNFSVYFDNDHDGVKDSNEDAWLASLGGGEDFHYNPSGSGGASHYNDTTVMGGTADTVALGSVPSEGPVQFEISHPLCSEDALDICVSVLGGDLGISFKYENELGFLFAPGPSSFDPNTNWADLTITPPGPPETTITAAPADYVQTSDASFSFTSSRSGSTFECNLDGAGFAACSSPASYSDLAEGRHELEVRAVSDSGVDSTPALWRWSVDTVPSDGALDQHQGATLITGFSIGGTSDQSLAQTFTAGVAGHLREVRAPIACETPIEATIHTTSDGVPAATVLASASATPGSGFTFKRFVFSPTPLLAVGTPYAVVFSGTVASCSLLDGPDNLYAGGTGFWRTGEGAWTTRTVDFPFATFVLESDPPAASITVEPDDYSRTGDVTIEFTADEDGSTFECSLGTGPFTACSSPVPVSSFVDGWNRFRVRATDPAGNTEPTFAVTYWLVDTAPAVGTLDQHQGRSPNPTGGGSLGGPEYAQTVTVGSAGALSEARVQLGCASSQTSTTTLEIQGTTGGAPNGVVLASQTLVADGVPFVESFVFSPAPAVTVGQQVALVLRAADTGCFVPSNGLDPYPGGIAFSRLSNTAPWSPIPSVDFVFGTFVGGSATFVVTTTADTVDDANCQVNSCTLRQAVNAANTHGGADVVTVPAGTYQLSASFGALVVSEGVTITGAGARSTEIRGPTGDRVFDIMSAAGPVVIEGLTLSGGTAHPDNGFFGGNVRNAGHLTLIDSTITNGSAYSGGGLSNAGGTMIVENSTISGNQAVLGGGDSGGIQNWGDGTNHGFLTVRNSTISGNTARLAGGILSWNDLANVTVVENSTIAFNTAGDRGLGGIGGDGSITLTGTIVAGNIGNGAPSNCDTNVTSAGFNLDTGTDCGFSAVGDLQNADPLLGGLADNGGPTDTHALAATSPAVDTGNADCPPPATDQRGVARPQGSRCDIGAFEFRHFVVDDAGDLPDLTVGDGLCETNAGTCTLRAAIQEANARPGDDFIAFAIPSAGIAVIQPASALPIITDPVVVDGTTQPGYGGTPVVRLDGSLAGANTAGIEITAGGSTVRGLSIANWSWDAVKMRDLGGNVVEDNYLQDNGSYGVLADFDSTNNTIRRNVITGNGFGAGGPYSGVGIFHGSDGNVVTLNEIGLDETGAPAPNSIGVVVVESTGADVNNNAIAHSAGAGVAVIGATATASIRDNDIADNGGLGIDLGHDGLTLNDAGDSDAGPNDLQNFPEITSVVPGDGETTVTGTVPGLAGQTFLLGVLTNVECDPSGHGEGVAWAEDLATTDASGAFAVDIPLTLPTGAILTATATVGGKTSEFSACFTPDAATVVTNTNDSGAGSLRAAILFANSNAGEDGITFAIPGSGPHTINLLTPLPSVAGPARIEGWTQPGFVATPLIELTTAGSFTGLTLTGQVVVRNLALYGFHNAVSMTGNGNRLVGSYVGLDGTGVVWGNANTGVIVGAGSFNEVGGAADIERNVIAGSGGNGVIVNGTQTSIRLNYIGTDAFGEAAAPNGINGVLVNPGASSTSVVENVISGNLNDGVFLHGQANVLGNRIGLAAESDAAIPNQGDGVQLNGSGSMVGDGLPERLNEIAHNGLAGVHVSGGVGNDITLNSIRSNGTDGIAVGGGSGAAITDNEVSGNHDNGISFADSGSNTVTGNDIGTDADGGSLGNGKAGVLISGGAQLNTIGPDNVIAFNGARESALTGKGGVVVTGADTRYNKITENAIFDNTGLGIDVGDNGPTAAGAPVLEQAVLQVGSEFVAVVNADLTSAPNDLNTIEFYAGPACDPSGFGEGQRFVGSTTVPTNVDGFAELTNFVVPGAVEAGETLTATATTLNDNFDGGSSPETSEFSNCLTVAGSAEPGQLMLTVDEGSIGAGAETVPLANVPGSFYGLAAGAVAPIPNSPIPNSPVGVAPIPNSPIPNSPIPNSPIPNSPIPNSPIPNSGFDGIPVSILDSILLSSIPLDWEEIFAGTSKAGLPAQSLTLKDVFTTPVALERFNTHTIGELQLEGTLLRGARFVSLIFGGTELQFIPPYTQAAWCAKLPSCAGVDVTRTTVLGLDVAGLLGFAGLGDVQIGQINDPGPAVAPIPNSGIAYPAPIPNSPIPNSPIPNSPIPNSPIPNSAFTLTSIGSIRIADLLEPGNVVNCSQIACDGTATLFDAFAADAVLPTARFVDLLMPNAGGTSPMATVKLSEFVVAYAGLENLPWESWPIDGFQEFAGIDQSLHYHLTATVLCGAPYTLRALLPQGFMVERGSSRLTVGTSVQQIADPVTDPKTGAAWARPALACATSQQVKLDFEGLPGFRLGSHTATAKLSAGGSTTTATGQAPVDVTENGESDNDPATAPTLAKDTLSVGHVATAGDIDWRRFAIPANATRGTRVMVFLNTPAGTDLDLFLSKPTSETLLSSPIPNSPIPNSPIPNSAIADDGSSLGQTAGDLAPEGLQDAPIPNSEISSSSIQRGDDTESAQVVLNGDEGGFVRIAVAGYNGAHSADAYTLRVKLVLPPDLPDCTDRAPYSAVGTLPPGIAADTETLFLMNYGATVAAYDATRANALVAKLQQIAARPEVKGAVIQVDGDPAVRSAKAAWDDDVCSPEAANDVVRKVNALTAGYRGVAPIKYVVVVGSDELMPMARVPDLTTDANESSAAVDLLFSTQGFTQGNALFASMYLGNTLTDAPYYAASTIPWFGRELYLEEVAGGRLVETPEDIIGQLDQYMDPAVNGTLSPQSSVVTGYDFMQDQASATKADVEARGATVDAANPLDAASPSFIGNFWRKANIEGYYSDPALSRDIVSVNGHYNHWQMAPAAPAPLTAADLVPTSVLPLLGSATTQFPRGIMFTIGCHAGLSVPDLYPDGGTPERLRDWAQALAQNNAAVYVANTGYGYGDFTAVALSERLLTMFSNELRTSGSVGEKFLAAKQNYFLSIANYDPYAEKALIEATFYGLPFYQVNSPAPTPHTPIVPVADPTGVQKAPFSFGSANWLTRHNTPRGSYWAPASGEVEFIKDRPLQPRVAQEVTAAGGLRAHGVRITALETHDEGGVDLVFAKPTIDLGAHEPEAKVRDTIFPAGFATVNRANRLGSPHDSLVVVAGQSRPGAGALSDERLVDRIDLEVLYSTSSDFTPPRFTQVGSIVTGNTATLFAVTDDAEGSVARVVAFFTEGDPVWRFVELTRVGTSNTYTATGVPVSVPAIQSGFWSQDDAGNVGYTTDKGFLFISKRGDAKAPEIAISSPSELQTVLLNAQLRGAYTCSDDGGVSECSGAQGATPVADGGFVDTSTVGEKSLVVAATDLTGNTTSDERRYRVVYQFSGFFEPVSNPPYVNRLKAGKGVALRFSLSGNQGLNIFAPGYPRSQQITCDPSVPIDTDVPTTSAGNSSLVYHSFSDSYIYIWKTESSWANTCRRLIFKFADGKERALDFKFVR